jgi:hypothetical protein
VAFEDLHWIDRSSADYWRRWSGAGAPMLVIVRPAPAKHRRSSAAAT